MLGGAVKQISHDIPVSGLIFLYFRTGRVTGTGGDERGRWLSEIQGSTLRLANGSCLNRSILLRSDYANSLRNGMENNFHHNPREQPSFSQ